MNFLIVCSVVQLLYVICRSCLVGDDNQNTVMISGTEVVIEASRASASMQPVHYSHQVLCGSLILT